MLEMNIPQSTVIQASEPFALKFNDVAKKLGLSRTGLNFLIAKNPDFPRPFKLSDGENDPRQYCGQSVPLNS